MSQLKADAIISWWRGSPVIRLVCRRVLLSVVSLLVVSLIVFFAVEILPGDTAERILGREATKASLEALRLKLHLADPASERYLRWFTGILHGDLGTSLVAERPVLSYIGPYLGRTLLLGSLALLLHIPLSIGLGLFVAGRQQGIADVVTSTMVIVGMSLPEFVVGIFLVMLFANELHIFPPLALIDQAKTSGEVIWMLLLPILTLNFSMTAYVVRQTRSTMIDILRSDYVRMARLRGLPPSRVIFRHALPNALGPAVNAIALNASWLIGGIVVVEVIFNYPGLGRLLVESIRFHDIPMILGSALTLSTAFIAVNLVADVSTLLLNPKLKTSLT